MVTMFWSGQRVGQRVGQWDKVGQLATPPRPQPTTDARNDIVIHAARDRDTALATEEDRMGSAKRQRMDRPLNVRVPVELFEMVEAEADRREITRSVLVREALVENLERRGLWPVDEEPRK
jgi:hypothetical protein